MISWEAVTAVSTVVTTVVLVLTVVLGRRQLDLLRRSTQLDGLIKTLAQLDEPRYAASYRFVTHDLASRMQDSVFRDQVARGALDEEMHLHVATLVLFERIGAYVRYGLLDAETVYCQAGARAVRAWEHLREVIELDRARNGPGAWDSYEALCAGTIRYFRQLNPNFPAPYKPANASAVQPAQERADA